MNTSFTPMVAEEIPARAMIAGLGILAIICAGLVMNMRFVLRVRSRGMPAPRYARRLLQRPWYWQDALWLALVMAVFVGTLTLVAVVLDRFDVQPAPSVARLVVVLQNLLTQALALGLVLHLCRRSGSGVAAGLGGPPARFHTRVRQALLFYVAAMPLIAASALVSNLLAALSGYSPPPQPVISGFIDVTAPMWFKGWLVGTAVITAPVVEEVVFRGVFLPAVARRNGMAAAIVITSMLFALIHGHPPAVLPLFTVGAFLSVSYLYTGSLLVPVLMHAVFNAVNLGALLLSGITLPPA